MWQHRVRKCDLAEKCSMNERTTYSMLHVSQTFTFRSEINIDICKGREEQKIHLWLLARPSGLHLILRNWKSRCCTSKRLKIRHETALTAQNDIWLNSRLIHNSSQSSASSDACFYILYNSTYKQSKSCTRSTWPVSQLCHNRLVISLSRFNSKPSNQNIALCVFLTSTFSSNPNLAKRFDMKIKRSWRSLFSVFVSVQLILWETRPQLITQSITS